MGRTDRETQGTGYYATDRDKLQIVALQVLQFTSKEDALATRYVSPNIKELFELARASPPR